MSNPLPRSDVSTTENGALRRLLSERAAAGSLTFHEFMATVLYHPRHGYYSSSRLKLGREGDFLTSPEVHPIFGACLARAVFAVWEALGKPSPLVVIEPGAGSGALAADLLSALTDYGVPRVEYRILEVSAALIERQRERLADWPEQVSWVGCQDLEPAAENAVLISNELFDSLPVHRVRVKDGCLLEVYVAEQDGVLVERLGPPSSPALGEYFEALGLLPGEGCTAEVNLEAPLLLGRLARSFQRGAMLTFDYGYRAADLYAHWRRDGTLLCYRRHSVDTNPYLRLGRQDITAHVDFTTLQRAGEEAGLSTAAFLTQAEFLAATGIGDYLAGEVPGAALEEFYARRRAVTDLIDPAGLGRLRLLIQHRGAPVGEALRTLLAGVTHRA